MSGVDVPGPRFTVKTIKVNDEEVQAVAVLQANVATTRNPIGVVTTVMTLLAGGVADRTNATIYNDSEATIYLAIGTPTAREPDIGTGAYDYVLFPEETYTHDVCPTAELKAVANQPGGFLRPVEFFLR